MHIHICVPTYSGSITAETAKTIFDLQNSAGCRFSLNIVSSLMVDIARNVLAHRFLEDETATHVLFLDDDIGFSASLLKRMRDRNTLFASAFYPIKAFNIGRLASTADMDVEKAISSTLSYYSTGNIVHSQDENGRTFDLDDLGFVRVTGIGLGASLISREVFAAIKQRFPDLTRPNTGTIYSRMGIANPVTRFFDPERSASDNYGEDVSFCRRWTACGGEIWACADERLTHVGRARFSGKLRDHLEHFGGLGS